MVYFGGWNHFSRTNTRYCTCVLTHPQWEVNIKVADVFRSHPDKHELDNSYLYHKDRHAEMFPICSFAWQQNNTPIEEEVFRDFRLRKIYLYIKKNNVKLHTKSLSLRWRLLRILKNLNRILEASKFTWKQVLLAVRPVYACHFYRSDAKQ